jgi:hypothetical protein
MAIKHRTCSCGEAVLWAQHERTGAHSPIDAAPSERGNLAIDEAAGTWRVIGKAEEYSGPRYLSHFVRCPHARRHSKKGAR